MRIAALDDEQSQLDLIKHAMQGIEHECHAYSEGKALLRDLRQQSFDLLILDWTLPDISGPAVVKWVREELASRMPILFVTNRSAEADLVAGLSAGADDFMVKPIRVAELEARVRALLRRAYPSQHETELQFGPYHFFPRARTLHFNDRPIELKHREYELALFLFQNLGRLLSREHLREAVWGRGPEEPSRSLDTHISRLRTKLALRPVNGFLLSAVYGLGYRLETVEVAALSAFGSSGMDGDEGMAA
ncbi:response regulator transcription factor [Variovorax sp. OV329]|uniref:response regulator transcription factor n=1 Tax=Variovorax sp. OV329 TaxID=1882825 RepID=UPI0008E87A5E|nr:response regulator transcription factor [Variovorax sp. OV329]SFM35156.1 DNA-binding response regulator, OmpR family, contains REC and winged-helix (wHTH) domain [Variovorax sp. OV329]